MTSCLRAETPALQPAFFQIWSRKLGEFVSVGTRHSPPYRSLEQALNLSKGDPKLLNRSENFRSWFD